jgi:hypothetical protein
MKIMLAIVLSGKPEGIRTGRFPVSAILSTSSKSSDRKHYEYNLLFVELDMVQRGICIVYGRQTKGKCLLNRCLIETSHLGFAPGRNGDQAHRIINKNTWNPEISNAL